MSSTARRARRRVRRAALWAVCRLGWLSPVDRYALVLWAMRL